MVTKEEGRGKKEEGTEWTVRLLPSSLRESLLPGDKSNPQLDLDSIFCDEDEKPRDGDGEVGHADRRGAFNQVTVQQCGDTHGECYLSRHVFDGQLSRDVRTEGQLSHGFDRDDRPAEGDLRVPLGLEKLAPHLVVAEPTAGDDRPRINPDDHVGRERPILLSHHCLRLEVGGHPGEAAPVVLDEKLQVARGPVQDERPGRQQGKRCRRKHACAPAISGHRLLAYAHSVTVVSPDVKENVTAGAKVPTGRHSPMTLRRLLSNLGDAEARRRAARTLAVLCAIGYALTIVVMAGSGAGLRRWFFALLVWGALIYTPLHILLEAFQTIAPTIRQRLIAH